MSKHYEVPENANAPQDKIEVHRILLDGGDSDVSIARGAWMGDAALLMRWNGNPDKVYGFPAKFRNMHWLVVPDWMHSAVLEAVKDRIVLDIKNNRVDISGEPS